MSDLKQLTQVEFNNIVKSLQNYEKVFHQFDGAMINVMFATEALQRVLIEKGIITQEELLAKAKEIDEKTAEAIQEEAEKAAIESAKEAAEAVQAQEAEKAE